MTRDAIVNSIITALITATVTALFSLIVINIDKTKGVVRIGKAVEYENGIYIIKSRAWSICIWNFQ
jgi:hypothetical protein